MNAKDKAVSGKTCPGTFQTALDALDVVGTWEWDPATDTVRVDGFVALLFCFDPEEAERGVPLLAFVRSIYADDRERVLGLVRQSARVGGPYLAEYRVCSADGLMRWVLARGRFSCDHEGRPTGGRGILVDMTRMRPSEARAGVVDSPASKPPLERAAEHAIGAHKALAEFEDPDLKLLAELLLMSIGRKLAQQMTHERRRGMN